MEEPLSIADLAKLTKMARNKISDYDPESESSGTQRDCDSIINDFDENAPRLARAGLSSWTYRHSANHFDTLGIGRWLQWYFEDDKVDIDIHTWDEYVGSDDPDYSPYIQVIEVRISWERSV